MLKESEIRTALKASTVIPLTISSPHGPLGLEQLAEEVRRLGTGQSASTSLETVSRPIPLKTETPPAAVTPRLPPQTDNS